jgi:hypothetical protein
MQQPASQRRPTLMGIPKPPPTTEETTVTVTQSELVAAATPAANAPVTRSKPPPPLPPKRSKPPGPPDASSEVAAAATPAPPVAKPRAKPPSPPKRSVPPPAADGARRGPPLKHTKTLEMEAVLEPSPPPGAAAKPATPAPPEARVDAPVESAAVGEKGAEAAAKSGEKTGALPRQKLLGAKDLLASLGDEEDDDNTLVRKSRTNEASSEPPPSEASEGEPSSRRAKTLEMTLNDHMEAAETKPVPKEVAAAETSEERPRTKTDRIPPPARLPADSFSDRPTARGSSPDLRAVGGQAVQVPRRSIVGVSLLWMVGLVSFFFVGRCSGIRKAAELEDAHEGLTKAFLLRALPRGGVTGAVASSEPKPCWVSRQPARWAKEASKSIPFVQQPANGSMSLGYAVGDKEGVGIVIDPKTGKFEERFRKKVDDPLARVAPMSTADGGFFLASKGDKDVLPVEAKTPFFLVLDKSSVGHAAQAVDAPAEIFHLEGDGDPTSPQVLSLKGTDERFFLSFRKGSTVSAGYFGASFAPLTALATVPGSGGKSGKPKIASNGAEVAIVFADMPEGEKKWQVRLGHAKVGAVPDATAVVDLPEGGPGGDKISPDLVGLDDGRWILMWTEGASGERAIRAITLTKDFQPIGDPIALSPPAGDFGQASLAVVGTYTTVVFLQRGEDTFEMWGAVLQCG